MTKAQKIAKYFAANPNAKAADVAAKFKVHVAYAYQVRKAHAAHPFETEKAPVANDRQVDGTHYKDMDIEPWEVIDTWPIQQRIGAYRAGVLKYTMRLGTKDEALKEAEKAQHYAQKLAEVLGAAR